MGQQQLLLLVLGIVIVGLAVVVGINAFGENQKRANADALVNDGLRIASDIQAYALKPAQFGGAGGFSNIPTISNSAEFFREKIGYPIEPELDADGDPIADSADDYNNVNGTFIVSGDGASGLVITGTNDDQDNEVYVTVCGVTSSEILTRIDYEGAAGGVTAAECD